MRHDLIDDGKIPGTQNRFSLPSGVSNIRFTACATAPPTAFDNDIFVGTRLALNDVSDTSILAGFAVDIDTQEMFFNVEAERRFGDNLSAELRLRAFTGSNPGEALHAFERDDYLQLRLSWYY